MNTDGRKPIEDSLHQLVEKVIGAAIEVHRALGPGFQEVTYHRAMIVELNACGIAVETEVPVDLFYKGKTIGQGRMDLVVAGQLVVELKAAQPNPSKYRKQVLVYLKATELRLGLVINFESELLKDGICRVAN